MQLAEEWVTTALAFGCGAARRRRSSRLMPSDLAPYLDSTWCALVTLLPRALLCHTQ